MKMYPILNWNGMSGRPILNSTPIGMVIMEVQMAAFEEASSTTDPIQILQ